MSDIAKELVNWHLVSKIEAAYDHGMSWDLDAICKEFKIDKTKHIKSLHVGKWGELEIYLNDDGVRALKANGWVGFQTVKDWTDTIKFKALTYPGDEWTNDYKWPISARYLDKDWEEVYEEEYN